jgi:4-amino-4-deoxychorismate lyase
MSRLIESIKLLNGQFHRLHYHQARLDQSVLELFQLKNAINLSHELSKQTIPKTGLFKCRVIYNQQIQSVEFIPYEPRPIQSLKVVHDLSVDYHLKYENRERINTLVEKRQFCDDILIVKNGFVTDSSYSNIIFFDGVKWVTPKSPLLKGTMRQFLLDAAEIKEEQITVQNIPSFRSFRLINAMLGFDGPEIDVTKIVL